MPNATPPATQAQFEERRGQFRALHSNGCFLLPNPWDIGGALRLERLGYKAIASSSSACAQTLGLEDYQISMAMALDHLRTLVAATRLPVNADFENGFADAPENVAENVRLAIATGIAGLSIEDRGSDGLYDLKLAAERIAAAKQAIEDSGENVVLVARTEAYLHGETNQDPVIERLQKYAEAGADCLYAPGAKDIRVISDIARAVAPLPLNVLMWGPEMRVADLADAGVRRVSLGGALASASWRGFDAAAREFLEHGRLLPSS